MGRHRNLSIWLSNHLNFIERKCLQHEYSSLDVYFNKANAHLKEGDYAQACEKAFGAMKFSIKSYVDEMASENHLMIHSDGWTYTKYKNVCMMVDNFIKKKEGQAYP